jgi:hypothetical protein
MNEFELIKIHNRMQHCEFGFYFIFYLFFLDDEKEPQPVDAHGTVKEERLHRSYTKAQARQRFKKGKS